MFVRRGPRAVGLARFLRHTTAVLVVVLGSIVAVPSSAGAADLPPCGMPFPAPPIPIQTVRCSPWRDVPELDSLFLKVRHGEVRFPTTILVWVDYYSDSGNAVQPPSGERIGPVDLPDGAKYVGPVEITNLRTGRVTTCDVKTWVPVFKGGYCRFGRLSLPGDDMQVSIGYLYRDASYRILPYLITLGQLP